MLNDPATPLHCNIQPALPISMIQYSKYQYIKMHIGITIHTEYHYIDMHRKVLIMGKERV